MIEFGFRCTAPAGVGCRPSPVPPCRAYFLRLPYPRGSSRAYAAFTIILMAMGLDFLTSASGAVTALANVGPGLDDTIGPAGNFAALPDSAKWLLSFGMILGRLDLFTVLMLFVPRLWRA
jgi:hypothetical protein